MALWTQTVYVVLQGSKQGFIILESYCKFKGLFCYIILQYTVTVLYKYIAFDIALVDTFSLCSVYAMKEIETAIAFLGSFCRDRLTFSLCATQHLIRKSGVIN